MVAHDVAFSGDGAQFARASGIDVHLCPFLPTLWEQEPEALLKQAQRDAGAALDGFALELTESAATAGE